MLVVIQINGVDKILQFCIATFALTPISHLLDEESSKANFKNRHD